MARKADPLRKEPIDFPAITTRANPGLVIRVSQPSSTGFNELRVESGWNAWLFQLTMSTYRLFWRSPHATCTSPRYHSEMLIGGRKHL